jgi:hypothetical protein
MASWRQAWVLIGMALLWAVPALAQATPQVMVLTETVQSSEDGFVSLDFTVRSADNLGVPDLLPGNISLSEANDNLTVSTDPRLNIALAVIVDLSVGGDVSLVQETLRAYVNTVYQDGDEVTFYILDTLSNAPRTVEITSRDQALSLINGLSATERFYVIELALDAALADLMAKGDVPSRPRHALYVGSYLTAPREAELSRSFANNGIPLHAVQAHQRRELAPLTTFAENGGGLYANNVRGSLVLAGDIPVNALRLLYDTINASRNVFQVRYRLSNPVVDGTSEIRLDVAVTADAVGSATFTYNWAVGPLTLTFADPEQLVLTRTPLRATGSAGLTFDRSSQSVTIQVNVPPGPERTLASVRLEAIHANTGEVLQSTLVQNPVLTNRDTLSLDWSLEPFSTPDSVTPVRLVVTLVDSFELRATAEVIARVEVGPAPPIPTPTVGIEVAEAVITVTAPPIAVVAVGADGEPILIDGEPLVVDSGISNTLTRLFVAIGLLVLVVVLALARLLRFTRRGPTPAPTTDTDTVVPLIAGAPKPEPVRVVGDEVAQLDITDDENFSTVVEVEAVVFDADEGITMRLVVREGADEIPNLKTRLIVVEQDEYTVGRSPDNDWQIDLPIISPNHCRLTVDDGGRVLVRDLDSKNGTYLNGERVPAQIDTHVPIGSELWITRDVIVEVYDAKMVIDDEMTLLAGAEGSAVARRVLAYRTLPGLESTEPTSDADHQVGNDYSPI